MSGVYGYSTTAASNTTVGGVDIDEGMAPSDVNNAMRAQNADQAKYRLDNNASITAGGSATVITLTTSSTITAYADGMGFELVSANDSTGAATLNVDAVGAKAIKKITSTGEADVAAGDMKAGGHYRVTYDASANSAAGAWILRDAIVTEPDVAFSGSEATITSVANDDVLYLEDTSDSGNGKKATLANILSTLLNSFRGLSAVAGDLFYADGSNTVARLAKGTAGQVLAMNSGATAPEWADPETWTYATPQATTSGTQFDFTGIPSGTTQIEVTFDGVSLSGTDNLLIQIGDSGGFETSGYESASALVSSVGAAGATLSTAGFIVRISAATRLVSGVLRLSNVDSGGTKWNSSHGVSIHSAATGSSNGGGLKTLSAELTQVRLTRSGTNNFDAGEVSIRYK